MTYSYYSIENERNRLVTAQEWARLNRLDVFDTVHIAQAELTPRGRTGGECGGIPVYRNEDLTRLFHPEESMTPPFLTAEIIREEFGLTTEGLPVSGCRIVNGEPVFLYKESDVIPPVSANE